MTVRAVVLMVGVVACAPKPLVVSTTGGGDSATPATTSGTPAGTPGGTPSTGATTDLSVAIDDYSWVAEVGTVAYVAGTVTSDDAAAIALSWSSDRAGPLGGAPADPSGAFRFESTGLAPGWHVVTVEAAQGGAVATDEVDVGICAWPPLEDFASGASIAGWTLFGNAAWDPGGWLEVTGNIQSSDGAIYKTDEKVNQGDVAIEFDIATGGGMNSGADGFAVNVVNAYDPYELAQIVNAAANGGCLGYGTAGACGALPIEAFHIEFDTWYNPELGDATSENHVAIALNGDPTPLLWVAVPALEDLVWRHVRVEIAGPNVTVLIDGTPVINGVLPGFTFDGGYIGVTGSTGWATNYHRFDNLQLYDLCRVPEAATP